GLLELDPVHGCEHLICFHKLLVLGGNKTYFTMGKQHVLLPLLPFSKEWHSKFSITVPAYVDSLGPDERNLMETSGLGQSVPKFLTLYIMKPDAATAKYEEHGIHNCSKHLPLQDDIQPST
ncbi:hypothetical protein STEG23_013485, partial [Scotinomys teguina]